jgi:hypothetical protein
VHFEEGALTQGLHSFFPFPPSHQNSARTIYYDLLPGFNNAYTRSQVSQRIARLNGEAKAAGLPPAKWPFPPGYLVPANERKSIYDIIPGGQEGTIQDGRNK